MLTWGKARSTFQWLPSYVWQRVIRRPRPHGPVHLIIALADHFEPSFLPGVAHGTWAPREEQERRLERWCREYPRLVDDRRGVDGRPFVHTYFYPAEQYDKALIDRLAEHCRAGWGEVEIQLHHGIPEPDTSANTARVLAEFRDRLGEHGCLSQTDDKGPPRYAFVHGNYALANSAGGDACGVDDEMQILAETGCYGDFTLPSAPNRSQVAKINALYECALPLDHRAPHRRGRDLESGRVPAVFPLIMQGPLVLGSERRGRGRLFPYIENGALTAQNPPTARRLKLWMQAAVTVRGRPDWLFIKLQCHGMDPRDDEVMLGPPIHRFLRELTDGARSGKYCVHFVTAREMVNISLLFLQISIEPRLGNLPFPHHGFGGDPKNFGRFVNREAAKVAELNNAGLTRVKLLQS